MFISNDINPYALIAVEREFADIITPPQKKEFTEAYKNTVNAMREQRIEAGAEPFEELTQVSQTPTDFVEFPQKETLPTGFRDMNESVSIDFYA